MKRWTFTSEPEPDQVIEIAAMLRDGNVVLLPTDTIYGVHALATDEHAVKRIADLKSREDAKPFIVLASSIEQLLRLGMSASPVVLDALRTIWPAPLTAILPLQAPIAASRGSSTLAARIPALDWFRRLLDLTGPLVSTSANRSGEVSINAPEFLASDLQERIDGIVDGGRREGEPSTIVDLSCLEPRLIRGSDRFFTQKLWKTLRKTP